MNESNSGEVDNIGDKTYEHIYGIDKIDTPEVDDNDSDTFEMSYKNMDFNDMDFEQTYTMYSTLQQKKALNVMDQLQKVQMLNQQYCTGIGQYEQVEKMKPGYGRESSKMLESQPRDEPRDEFDQFFSNNESNALEKFLDNLANSNGSANPMHMYNDGQSNYQHDFPVFELHTMKAPTMPMPTPPQHSISPSDPQMIGHDTHGVINNSKKVLADAFGHPSLKNLTTPDACQLPTPMDSRQSSTSFNVVSDHEMDQDSFSSELSTPQAGSPGAKKRKRSCHKPLLTVEQKRLNHSLSEKKRRQQCKLAYERCLRLITNIDDYTDVKVDNSKGKSKRKQINKDGLPNLSKHTALTKITNEMIKIKEQNDGLKKLLNLE
ncbi:uncharacterized protein AC631_05829 [Debaryomyces fabryi]|uniref:BHLH domain-containing protein n=1 Tax=Debaryomyces fabryi TaxID=58627 RepID=A0A0V1PQ81_9ASCO|nr:uncharacterized protein AC631_05829 [Debaryomyces fabryi]KRZ98408.1 hypothetical protein AC631_05829 [Debaryomyces fabryi]CUM48046.1 unnamed protein product [Debaryomyces fabryi]